MPKRRKLKIGDFKRVFPEGSYLHYFSYKQGKYEICLEPCLNGYDVGLYIYENLIQDKICTNLEVWQKDDALNKAVEIANKLWNKKEMQ